MPSLFCCVAPDRGVLTLTGTDRERFLQSLVSNDMRKVSAGHAQWAALLTPQGKYLHDFFVAADGDQWLIESDGNRVGDLRQRLDRYRLRSKVVIEDRSADYTVWHVWGDGLAAALGFETAGSAAPFAGGIAFIDPRDARLGARLVLPCDGAVEAISALNAEPAENASWDRLRLSLGVPDGSRDLMIDKTILLEAGFEELHGVAFDKGCYIGQELTARTKYRGLIKRRLLPVTFEGAAPPPGTPVLSELGADVGDIRSGREGIALALVRLDALTGPGRLTAGGTVLMPSPPDWLMLSE